jgi:hypothetical protein
LAITTQEATLTHATPSAALARGALCLSTLLALAACGGGGGDAGSPGASTGPLAITADNANTTASAAVMGAGMGASVGDASSLLSGFTAQQATVSQARRAYALAASALSAQRRPLASTTLVCTSGGTLTISLSDSNGNNLLDKVGESVSATAANCGIDASSRVNGKFTLQLTGYTDLTHLSFTLSFSNFAASDTTTGQSEAIDGIVTASIAGSSAISITSPSITGTSAAKGVSHSYTVQSFVATVTNDGSQTSETLSGTFTSSDFGGKSVTLSTLAPVVILASDDYPSQGALLIQGANQSALRIDALNATQAQLSIDADGNGTYETVKVVNWADLG